MQTFVVDYETKRNRNGNGTETKRNERNVDDAKYGFFSFEMAKNANFFWHTIYVCCNNNYNNNCDNYLQQHLQTRQISNKKITKLTQQLAAKNNNNNLCM